ncbi:MAG TPA: thioredoxin family protein [Armatimonadota bacterium]|nr:thioredoxin family protein [Armatimonadota bacterium]
MQIKVYGTGCAKCRKAETIVRRALAETGNTAEVVRVSDLKEIVMAGVLRTPAVAVDDAMKVIGRAPTLDEVKGWIG